MKNDALPRGKHLAYRLERPISRRAEAMFFLTIGGVLAPLGTAGILWSAYRLLSGREFSWGPPAVALISAFAALLGYGFGWSGVRTFLASRMPDPVLEIDRDELHPGDHVELHFTQPGPAQLEEIFVTLRCDKSVLVTSVEKAADGEVLYRGAVKTQQWETSIVRVISILRETNVALERGERLERQLFFEVPEDVEVTVSTRKLRFEWQFEIEGRPADWPSYVDEFPIVVRRRD